MMGNISFFNGKKNSLPPVMVVLNVRYFFPWGHKAPKYVIASGKRETEIRYCQFFHFHLCVHFENINAET